MSAFLGQVWTHLANITSDPQARLCLVRMLKARGITGHPTTGWRF